nr:penicillin-binding transpeptidase domain-containing protein [Pantoea dispersa]
MGQHRFEDYVKAFAYGNEDVSAVDVSAPGQNRVWVMSSLQISPVQQIGFLRKVVNRELHVNKHAYDMTDNITRYDVSVKGWTVHGKTGTGSPGKNNQYDPHHAYGWYVGWATKGRKKIVFAKLIQDEQVLTPNAGLRARDEVLKQMSAVIAP